MTAERRTAPRSDAWPLGVDVCTSVSTTSDLSCDQSHTVALVVGVLDFHSGSCDHPVDLISSMKQYLSRIICVPIVDHMPRERQFRVIEKLHKVVVEESLQIVLAGLNF